MRAYDNKIIFAGPVGAGKTTAIGAISDIAPVTTDARASDMTLNRKDTTTVALDYGVLMLDEAPRCISMAHPARSGLISWDILSHGGIGLILLLDNTRTNPVKDLQFFLNAFRDMLKDAPLVIGVTKTDMRATPSIETYAALLEKFDMRPPIFEIDARSREDVKKLVLALLFSIDPGLES
jgi:signal recognition particle receptor subunit beta